MHIKQYCFNRKKGNIIDGLSEKRFNKNILFDIAITLSAPLIVLMILFSVYAANGLYPFGTGDITCGDMRQQVVPLLLDFKDILAGKDGFFLNMHNASGMNFYGVFLFFLSSPFSLLVVFVDKADMAVFMNVLTALKMAMSALTSVICLRCCRRRLHPYYAVLFSVAYAFCGYAMMFFQNNVWLDVMYLFPLLLMCTEALIKRRKTLGFILCLVGMLALNFYLSYMVVLFLIFFISLYLFINRKKANTKGVASHFAVSCFIAALISSVVWLPALIQYLSSARGTDVIGKMLDSAFFTPIYTNLPFLFCSGVMLVTAVVFFGRGRKSTTKFYSIMFILTLIPVVIEPINKMWHTGDYMCFPVRYGFITIFMLIMLITAKLSRFGKDAFPEKSNIYLTVGAFLICICTAVSMTVYYRLDSRELDEYICTLWGNSDSFVRLFIVFVVFAIVITALFCLAFTKKIGFRGFVGCLAVLLAGECVFDSNVYLVSASKINSSYSRTAELADVIPPDDDFYRVKMEQGNGKYFDANLIGGFGYNTISHYTSLTSQDYMFAMKRLGYSSYWMEVTGNGGTLFTDALFSNKYTIAKFSARDNAVFRNKNFVILKNEFYLPLGTVVSSEISDIEKLPELDRIELQEYLAQTMFNEDHLFVGYAFDDADNIELSESDGRYYYKVLDNKKTATLSCHIRVSGRQTLYFDCFDQVSARLREHINNSFDVYVNGARVSKTYPNKDINGLLELGTFEDTDVEIQVDALKSDSCASFGVYGLMHDAMDRIIGGANNASLNASGNSICGTATAKDGDLLFLSVPYDNGFEAYVNGKEAAIYEVLSGFMALKLEEGENDIIINFLPQGFKAGMFISIAGIALLILFTAFKKSIMSIIAKADTVIRRSIYIFGFAAAAAVYIIPIVLCAVGAFIE